MKQLIKSWRVTFLFMPVRYFVLLNNTTSLTIQRVTITHNSYDRWTQPMKSGRPKRGLILLAHMRTRDTGFNQLLVDIH